MDGMTVKLETVRARLRDLFLGWVGESKPGGRWGIAPPSSMAVGTGRRGPGSAQVLAGLRSLVETAWFAPSTPSLADVEAAEALDAEREGDS